MCVVNDADPHTRETFRVNNGSMFYLIDPLNEICLASEGRAVKVFVPHEACMRLIQRYSMPLPALPAEATQP